MTTKTYNKKPLVSSSEHFLRLEIKRYEQNGWRMKGFIVQSSDGSYSCLMVREHTARPNNAS